MRLTPDSLPAHLERGLLPAYLVSGDEPLLVSESADALRARARAAGFTERSVHFIERAADWEDVRGSAANLSLFGSRRLLEIRLSSGKAGTAGGAMLVSLLSASDPDALILILSPRLERDSYGAEWVRALEQRGGWVQVWPVESQRLVTWLAARCRRLKLDLDGEALQLLAERTEGNLLAAHQELEKLVLTANPGRVSADSLLASVADSARFDVFQLGEAVLAGEPERALRVLAVLKGEGTEPTLVLWSLTKALRDLWGALSGGAAPPPRGSARQAAALERAARRVPRSAFRALTLRAERTDRMVKGREQGDPWDEMALLAVELAGSPALPGPRDVLK